MRSAHDFSTLQSDDDLRLSLPAICLAAQSMLHPGSHRHPAAGGGTARPGLHEHLLELLASNTESAVAWEHLGGGNGRTAARRAWLEALAGKVNRGAPADIEYLSDQTLRAEIGNVSLLFPLPSRALRQSYMCPRPAPACAGTHCPSSSRSGLTDSAWTESFRHC